MFVSIGDEDYPVKEKSVSKYALVTKAKCNYQPQLNSFSYNTLLTIWIYSALYSFIIQFILLAFKM